MALLDLQPFFSVSSLFPHAQLTFSALTSTSGLSLLSFPPINPAFIYNSPYHQLSSPTTPRPCGIFGCRLLSTSLRNPLYRQRTCFRALAFAPYSYTGSSQVEIDYAAFACLSIPATNCRSARREFDECIVLHRRCPYKELDLHIIRSFRRAFELILIAPHTAARGDVSESVTFCSIDI